MKVILNPLPLRYEQVELEIPEECPECGEPVGDVVDGVYYVWMPYYGSVAADGKFKPSKPTFDNLPDAENLTYPANIRCMSCGEEFLVPSQEERKYIKSEGTACGFCDSTDLRVITPLEMVNNQVLQSVGCNGCGKQWTDTYSLTGMSVDEVPEEKSDGVDQQDEPL